MSHKVHPYAHRLVVLRDWKSRWFARGPQYRQILKADTVIREFLEKQLRGFYVDSIEMERGQDKLRVIIKTSRPGLIIGRSGEGSTKLKQQIFEKLKKEGLPVPRQFQLDIQEVKSPESRARIVAHMIVESLEKRLPYRRVLKQILDKVMANRDVLGARVVLSGRLGGTDIARTERASAGRLPLQTLRADIDFARERAHLPYGDIGIKVWIYRGEIFADKESAKNR